MNKKIISTLVALLVLISASGVSAKVYYAESSSVLFNEDGITQSASVNYSPIGGNTTLSGLNSVPDGVTRSGPLYAGGVFDGTSIWLVPYDSENIVKIDSEGTITTVPFPEDYTKSSGGFYGGAFDGINVYFAPYNADGILSVNVSTGDASYNTDWPVDFDKSTVKFKGAVYDGEHIWFIPAEGGIAVSLSSDGVQSSYTVSTGETANEFSGGIYTGNKILLVPDASDEIVEIDCNTGAVANYSDWPSGFTKTGNGFHGAIYDGSYAYLIPSGKFDIIRVSPNTGDMTAVPLPESEDNMAFSGAAFDGRFVWMSPTIGNTVLKYDTNTNLFDTYALDTDLIGSYVGGVFDGSSAYLMPHDADNIIKISGDNTPPTAMNVFLTTTVGVAVSGEMVASDPDEGDTITFTIVSEPAMGTVEMSGDEGDFTYTPTGTQAGTDTFTYKANDGKDDSNIATVTITIEEEEEEPTMGRYIDLWGHWGEPYAEALTDMEVMLGENVDGYYYFYPNYLLTRAGFMVLANSAFGFEGDINDSTLPFIDIVDAEKWIIKAASGAFHGNMIHGFPVGDDVELRPLENLTRLEAMTIIYNVINPEAAEDEALDFADNDLIPEWAVSNLKSLKKIGLLSGYTDNTLRPFNTVSRIEAAKMLYEALSYMNGNNQARLMLK